MERSGETNLGLGCTSRRNVLKSAGLVGATAVTGLSGCLGTSVLGGGSTYTEWMYAPAEVDADHYAFWVLQPDTWTEYENELDDELYSNYEGLEEQYAATGVDFDDLDSIIRFESVSVLTGSFESEDVVEHLVDFEEFTENTEHEGFTIYVGHEGLDRTAVGVADGTIVRSEYGYDANAVETVELAIDTKQGTADRYVDENEHFAALTDALGDGVSIRGRTMDEVEESIISQGEFQHMLAGGSDLSINGETAQFQATGVFEEADDIEKEDLEEWIDSDIAFAEVEDPSIKTNGRIAKIVGTVETSEITYNLV
jgi:hypothetical protein